MRDSASRRPVIAQVLHQLWFAGAEVLAADLARRLRGRYDFVFLCLDKVGPLGEQLAAEGFPVVNLERRPGVDWAVARRLRRVIRDHAIDLLHAHQYTPFFYAAAARRLGRRPVILFTEHGRHYPDYRRWKRVLANRWLLKGHDRITAVGNWTRQCLIDHEGLPAERIEVVYNGIDPRKFTLITAERRQAMRTRLGLAAETPVILQVARFHPVKGHATILRAVAELTQQSPEAAARPVLLLAGDGEKRREMEALAQHLGIASQVRFLGVRQDVADLLGAADVFTLSSLSEGISVTLLEAMAAGLPIATTEVGGNPEVVAAGETGLLSPRGDAHALAGNLHTLLADAALRQRMGAAARQRVEAMFTQEKMHARYAAIYDEMLGGGAGGR